jgi:hypothetical protein
MKIHRERERERESEMKKWNKRGIQNFFSTSSSLSCSEGNIVRDNSVSLIRG